MNQFDYVRPSTVAEAIAVAAEPGAAFLAGGTNLVDLMKVCVARPARLVDIRRLPGLDRIEWLDNGGARVGALVRKSDLAYDPRFARTYPAVAEALLSSCGNAPPTPLRSSLPQLPCASRLDQSAKRRAAAAETTAKA